VENTRVILSVWWLANEVAMFEDRDGVTGHCKRKHGL